MKILGIDPGTGICGFGVIEIKKSARVDSQIKMLDNGVITTPAHTPLPERLEDIYNSLHEIIKLNQPDCVSIEKLFFTKNITTGISVAEARGVVMLVCKQHIPQTKLKKLLPVLVALRKNRFRRWCEFV